MQHSISSKACLQQVRETTFWNMTRNKSQEEWYITIAQIIYGPEVVFATGDLTEEEQRILTKCMDVLVKRIKRLLEKQRKARGDQRDNWDDKTEFFQATDFPELVLILQKSCTLPMDAEDISSSQVSYVPSSQETDVSSQQSEILQGKPGRKKVSFDELTSDKSKRRRTDEIMKSLEDFAEENEMTMSQLLAYIGHRHYYVKDRPMAKTFGKILNGQDPYEPRKVNTELALYLREHSQNGRRAYEMQRHLMQDLVEWPQHHTLTLHIKTIVPTLHPFMNGLTSDLSQSLKLTVSRHLSVLEPAMTEETRELIVSQGISVDIYDGVDGSGSHRQYNQNLDIDTSHFLVSGYHLNSIRACNEEKTIIFEEKGVSSNSQRPLFLVPGRESHDNFEEAVQRLEQFNVEAMRTGASVQFGGQEIQCKIKAEMTHLDGKAVVVALGAGGAYCTGCTVSQKQGMNPDCIRDGFPLNKTLADMHALFNDNAVPDEDGEMVIQKRPNDYETRRGQTHRPMLTSMDISTCIPVLHAWINGLSFWERFAYRFNAKSAFVDGKIIWGPGKPVGPAAAAAIKREKYEFRAKAMESPLSMRLDMPDASGSGGSSDTGNVARMFFSEQKREAVVALFKGTDQEKHTIRDLLQRFNVILRLLSSKDKPIYSRLFEEYCTDTYLLLVNSFDWALVSTSVHRVLGHAPEAIRKNGGYGLGAQSEEPLETTHKYLRKFRETLARKTSLEDNIEDVFKRLYLRSDPVVRSKARVLRCSFCQEEGHTRRGCRLRFQEASTHDDALVNSFFVT